MSDHNFSRREILLGAGTATTAAAVLAGTAGVFSAQASAAVKTSYGTGVGMRLLLNGADQGGFVTQIRGGEMELEAVSDAAVVQKVGNVVLTIEGGRMNKSFYDWVKACLQGQPGTQRTVEIPFLNYEGQSVQTLALQGARAVEIQLGGLAASSAKDLIRVDVTLAAATVTFLTGGPTILNSPRLPPFAQYFGLFIEGFEAAAQSVRSVSELAQATVTPDMFQANGKPTRPLSFTVDSQFAGLFRNWFQQWLKGKRDPRQGVLQLHSLTKEVVASVDLINLTPLRINGLAGAGKGELPATEVTLTPYDLRFNLA